MAAVLKPVGKRLSSPQPAGAGCGVFTILASRWWQVNRCTPMAAPSPAHLLAGRAGGWAPAPRQLQRLLLPGMAADDVVRD